MDADPDAASDPTPDLREQAVEAALAVTYRPCLNHNGAGCTCALPGHIRAVVDIIYPLVWRAALDRAEDRLRDEEIDPLNYEKRRTWKRAADLVASLRDGEPGG